MTKLLLRKDRENEIYFLFFDNFCINLNKLIVRIVYKCYNI